MLIGNQGAPEQTRLINGIAKATERIPALVIPLGVFQKMADGLFDQVVGPPITAFGQFLPNLLSQIRRQSDFHLLAPDFILAALWLLRGTRPGR